MILKNFYMWERWRKRECELGFL